MNFLAALFDFSFSRFVTSKIVRFLYALSTAIIILWALLFIVVAFKASAVLGALALLIGAPLGVVLALTYTRVVLEVMIVLFRISENVGTIAGRSGASFENSASAPQAQPLTAS